MAFSIALSRSNHYIRLGGSVIYGVILSHFNPCALSLTNTSSPIHFKIDPWAQGNDGGHACRKELVKPPHHSAREKTHGGTSYGGTVPAQCTRYVLLLDFSCSVFGWKNVFWFHRTWLLPRFLVFSHTSWDIFRFNSIYFSQYTSIIGIVRQQEVANTLKEIGWKKLEEEVKSLQFWKSQAKVLEETVSRMKVDLDNMTNHNRISLSRYQTLLMSYNAMKQRNPKADTTMHHILTGLRPATASGFGETKERPASPQAMQGKQHFIFFWVCFCGAFGVIV